LWFLTFEFVAGVEIDAHGFNAEDCIKAVTAGVLKSSGEILAVLQYLSPTKRVPHDVATVMDCVAHIPTVVDWLRRSACRRGATMALSLGQAHFPEDFEVQDVTSGFPSETGVVDKEEVLALMSRCAPYADRVLEMTDLAPQASMVAPEDVEDDPPVYQDFATGKPFEAARAKKLTTYPRPKWTPRFDLVEGFGGEHVPGSSSEHPGE